MIEHVKSVPLEAILILTQPQAAFNVPLEPILTLTQLQAVFNVHMDKILLGKEAQNVKMVRIFTFIYHTA